MRHEENVMRERSMFSVAFFVMLLTLVSMGLLYEGGKPAYANTVPTIEVHRPLIIMGYTGLTFQLDVTVNNLQASQQVVGIQFRLLFNATLLEFISVTEGPFLPYYASQQPGSMGTWFSGTYEPDGGYGPHVLCGELILPNSTGEYNPPYPEGNGTIATISFKTAYKGSKTLSCDLVLMDTQIVNSTGGSVTHEVRNGLYKMRGNVGDVNADGVVDMKDVFIVGKAYGECPGRPRWNPIADITPPKNNEMDCIVDARDYFIAAHNFGWDETKQP